MKKTDLEKNKGLKLRDKLHATPIPPRFGQAAAQVLDKREQRKRDQALGLVPFATKLQAELVKELHAFSLAQQKEVSEVVAELLQDGLNQRLPK